MVMFIELQQAFSLVFLDPVIWMIVIGSAVYGIFLGSMPGLTATMGVALFVPMTYWMEPVPALAAIVTMVACAIFAGDIPTTLMRVPGTPASAAYADDAYALAKRGEASKALGEPSGGANHPDEEIQSEAEMQMPRPDCTAGTHPIVLARVVQRLRAAAAHATSEEVFAAGGQTPAAGR